MTNTKVGGRHSANDWATIKATRKAGHAVANMAQAIVAYMQELGDDGLDNEDTTQEGDAIESAPQQQDAKAFQVDSGPNTPETGSNALAGGSSGHNVKAAMAPQIKNVEALSQRQQYLVGDLLEIVADMGQFSPGIDSEGAHYMPAMSNGFASRGIMCEECVFYSPVGACAIVSGMVESYGVCKFWVIPNAVLAAYVNVPAIEQPQTEMPEGGAEMGMMSDHVANVDTKNDRGIISEATREYFRQVLNGRN